MALDEDLGAEGDVTSIAIFADERRRCSLVSKDTGVLAGSAVFARVFALVDPASRVAFLLDDGASLAPGQAVARIEGRATGVLSAERVALNFVSFLSGIATQAREFVEAAGGRVTILDTRKTLPGFRDLSKYAVRVGGARNHRSGLHDMVLIKDNHIDMAGSIELAVARVRHRWGRRFRVEVECRSEEEVRQAVDAGADIVMLDNMAREEMERSLRLRRGAVQFEISGNMTLERVRDLSGLGADSISVGSLTHSVRRFDFSLVTDGGGS
jgi:nicotinate-nucleotide pyrophosphorylase (carboxylating)